MMNFTYGLLFFITGSLLVACSSDAPDVINGFYADLYAGRQFNEGAWLSEDAKSSKIFSAFGGLNEYSKNISLTVRSGGGVRTISTRVLSRNTDTFKINVVVVLNNGNIITSDDYWLKTRNKWLLTTNSEKYNDSFAP